jgi:hypothetical protein
METEQLEKQFQLWNRLMYMALGASVAFVVISFGCFINPRGWPSFANYTSGPWMVLQLLVTPPGFYLLWSNRWKTLAPQSKINTISGYFIASWFNLIAFGLMIQQDSPTELSFVIACGAILIPLVIIWALWKRAHPKDEIFP